MEKQGSQERYYNHLEPIIFTPEQLALQSLVDELIRRSDEEAFKVLNKILERVREENG